MHALRPVLSLVALATVASAQSAAWALVASSGPQARYLHAMAFDVARSRVVMFGGYRAGSLLGDTWTWDGTTWAPQLLATSPGARIGSAMVYDSVRNRVVLFGGSSVSSVQADTWEWDGTTWILVNSNGPGRGGHAMAFDSLRGRTVLFGGSANGTLYSGTWEWDGATWSLVTLTGNPPVRDAAAMVFDPVRGRSLLYGGWGTSGVRNDAWEWDGATWSSIGNGPPGRFHHAMVYDAFRQRTVLFGGLVHNNPTGGEVAETWEWDGTTWTLVASGQPTPRYAHAVAFDSARRVSVLFGGGQLTSGPATYFGDTWAFGASSLAQAFGTGCGSPALTLAANAAAPPRIGSTATADVNAVPSALVFVALGTSNTFFNSFPLPVTLASIGMPGCNLLQSADVVGEPATMTSTTTASYGFAIPNNAALVGMHLYLQAWAWAPGANAANIVVSNGLDWQLGY